jgi:hypothetical protein
MLHKGRGDMGEGDMDPEQPESDSTQQDAGSEQPGADRQQPKLPLRQRLLIGCFGAMAPILVNLCVVDLNTVFSNLLPLVALTYIVRLVGLCGSACVVVFLNSDEHRPVKLFQLGVMAPAVITQLLNGAAAVNKTPTSMPPAPPAHTWLLIPEANAQPAPAPQAAPTVRDCTKPQDPTVSQQILKGLVGITPGNQWFVVVGSYGSAQAAIDDAKQVNVRFPGKYDPQVCSPTEVPNSPYRVVIAQYMTYADAARVKNDAIAAGLPPDTWLWNPFAVTQ